MNGSARSDDDAVTFTEDARRRYDTLSAAHRQLVASVLAQDLEDTEREYRSLAARLAIVTHRRDSFRQRLDYLRHLDHKAGA